MFHYLESYKNKGSNKQLKGHVGFCYILVDTPRAKWLNAAVNRFTETAGKVSSFFMSSASIFHADLTIDHLLFRDKTDHDIDLNNQDYDTFKTIIASLKFKDFKDFRKYMRSEYHFDDVALIFVLPNRGISFAVFSKRLWADEYAVILAASSPGVIAHEICHLYGAMDLYYTDDIKDKVREHLEQSIMMDNSMHIDDLTAYLIGWNKTPSASARAFLKETKNLNQKSWYEAMKAQLQTRGFEYKDDSEKET